MDANRVKDHAVDPPKTPLPEPDNDNITVLTSKLPNEPILPWNRYDSPWLESEASETSKESPEPQELQESAAASDTASPGSAPPVPETPAPDTQVEAGSVDPTSTPLGDSPGDEGPTEAATAEQTIAPPLPATNHYLIDLAFEGSTD